QAERFRGRVVHRQVPAVHHAGRLADASLAGGGLPQGARGLALAGQAVLHRRAQTGVKLKRASIGLCLAAIGYLLVLGWINSTGAALDKWSPLAASMPVLLGAAVASWLLRFARWQWLLSRAGHEVPPGIGLLAFLSGFAFTATPGKVGELVRIRYLAPLG